ncbi:MAG: demethoxyubiquinone hydroxylase family protein, partial [Betaproteobacteria bacterium]
MSTRSLSRLDQWLSTVDQTLRTLSGGVSAARPTPVPPTPQPPQALSEEDRRHSAALMRVNHVGEVCAQALYQAQSL